MNRRGSAVDVLLIGVLLFAVGIGFLLVNFTAHRIYGGLLNNL